MTNKMYRIIIILIIIIVGIHNNCNSNPYNYEKNQRLFIYDDYDKNNRLNIDIHFNYCSWNYIKSELDSLFRNKEINNLEITGTNDINFDYLTLDSFNIISISLENIQTINVPKAINYKTKILRIRNGSLDVVKLLNYYPMTDFLYCEIEYNELSNYYHANRYTIFKDLPEYNDLKCIDIILEPIYSLKNLSMISIGNFNNFKFVRNRFVSRCLTKIFLYGYNKIELEIENPNGIEDVLIGGFDNSDPKHLDSVKSSLIELKTWEWYKIKEIEKTIIRRDTNDKYANFSFIRDVNDSLKEHFNLFGFKNELSIYWKSVRKNGVVNPIRFYTAITRLNINTAGIQKKVDSLINISANLITNDTRDYEVLIYEKILDSIYSQINDKINMSIIYNQQEFPQLLNNKILIPNFIGLLFNTDKLDEIRKLNKLLDDCTIHVLKYGYTALIPEAWLGYNKKMPAKWKHGYTTGFITKKNSSIVHLWVCVW